MVKEPLAPADAKKQIVAILSGGTVSFSRHAENEMANDPLGSIDRIDVVNVLRGGVVDPAELVNETWRYRVRTQRISVVVAFRSEMNLIVVTAWRNGP
jgi:hypothetical protein